MTTAARATAAPLVRLVRSELSLALARPRTAVTLAVLAIVPLLSASGLRAVGGERAIAFGVALVSVTEFTALTLAVPVVLVAADSFAAERAQRTLDLLRLSPVGDGRLVLLKSAGIVAASLLVALVATGAAVLAGLALLPLGPYTAGATLGRELLLAAWMAGQLAGLGLLVMPLSMMVRRTAGVVATGLAPVAVGVLTAFDFVPRWVAVIAPTGNWMDSTTALSRVPVDWSPVAATTLRAAAYAVLGVALTLWLLGRRDE